MLWAQHHVGFGQRKVTRCSPRQRGGATATNFSHVFLHLFPPGQTRYPDIFLSLLSPSVMAY